MLHELKTDCGYFEETAKGNKLFEVRVDDRPYELGDFIALNEWDGSVYTGRCLLLKISSVLRARAFVKEGFVTLGLVPCFITVNEAETVPFSVSGRAPCIYGKKRQSVLKEVVQEVLVDLPEPTPIATDTAEDMFMPFN